MSPVNLGIVFCEPPLGRVVWQQSPYRPGLDGVDRQSPSADPPTRTRQFVFIVVAQMPDHVDDLIGALIPVMRDAGDASPRAARPSDLVVDLADDRVLGTRYRGDRGNGCGDGLLTSVRMYRLQRGRRVWHRQLGVHSEKLCDRWELTIVNAGRVPVHQIAEASPVVR